MLLAAITGFTLALTFAGSLRAEDPQRIEKLMSRDQFRAAGLNKLTPEELGQLNGWLYGYTNQREKVASQQAVATERAAAPKRVTSSDTVESRVDGPFDGLSGGTIIRLQNGQVYQQANYSDTFQVHLDSPEVVIQKNVFGSVMLVNGFSRRFYVRRLSGN